VEALLERYRRYLRVERRLAAVTIEGYVCRVRFVERRVVGAGLSLEDLAAGDVVAFVLSDRPRRSRGSVKLTVTALRSLLRFLHVDGALDEPLTRAVPTVAHWRLAGLPRPLEPGELDLLLTSCRLDTETGRRDVAILKLLARLGLRAGEVAGLRLDDIDWRAGEVRIRGKGGREDRLPLPTDVGEVVAEYLRAGRPAGATGRSVFVRAIAPRDALTPRAVTKVVIRAGARAGIGQVAAHRLRHTAATDMLRAGASLAEIGQVLRHCHLSTAIYAKVDREPLRELARPWPGGAA
jgi:site-specific recombinase XerD